MKKEMRLKKKFNYLLIKAINLLIKAYFQIEKV